jgi:hypothetical protein
MANPLAFILSLQGSAAEKVFKDPENWETSFEPAADVSLTRVSYGIKLPKAWFAFDYKDSQDGSTHTLEASENLISKKDRVKLDGDSKDKPNVAIKTDLKELTFSVDTRFVSDGQTPECNFSFALIALGQDFVDDLLG